MNKIRLEYLISYDVEDNRSRTKLYRQLLAYGLKGIQKSVCWGYLTKAEVTAIERLLRDCLAKRDRAFITPVHFDKTPRKWLFGYQSSDFEDWPEYDCI